MDLQFFGANCFTLSNTNRRLVFDDNLIDYGLQSISKEQDICFFTEEFLSNKKCPSKLIFDNAGEFEIDNISIQGIEQKKFKDDDNSIVMFKINVLNINILLAGNIGPDINQKTLEEIGMLDILIIPCGNGLEVIDSANILKIVHDLEPKILIPSFYFNQKKSTTEQYLSLEQIIKNINLDIKERTNKLKLKNLNFQMSTKTELIVFDF